MKTLGLIGGTSWISTVDYYRHLNTLVSETLGDTFSAKLLMYSVNFDEFKRMTDAGDWDLLADTLSDIAQRLENAGAEGLMLCANTMHVVADKVQGSIGIPLLHISDATAMEINRQNLKKVALLGTRFTMESEFYPNKFTGFGIETMIPGEAAKALVHDSIFSEMTKGIFTPETKRRYLEVINELKRDGAEGVVYACTEIPVLIKPDESPIPSFDTALIHSRYAVDFALSD
jgi:aspartate racemase